MLLTHARVPVKSIRAWCRRPGYLRRHLRPARLRGLRTQPMWILTAFTYVPYVDTRIVSALHLCQTVALESVKCFDASIKLKSNIIRARIKGVLTDSWPEEGPL